MKFLTIILTVLCISSRLFAAGGYWQQHASYTMDVTLQDEIHTLQGTSKIVYTNHAPDTLHEVYFHLYYNAFQPGSMMDERSRAIKSRPVVDLISKLPKSEWGVYTIPAVNVNGHSARFKITGTIMRVELDQPLAPEASVTLELPNWQVQIPRVIRRGGWGSRENIKYSMSQWYPKIAEYDNEGWQAQEYIAREFYGVWGDFDVTLHLPSKLVVGATGECQNPREVGHGYQLIANGEKEGRILPTDASEGMTAWHFTAHNVHDFAWVADPEYIHEWRVVRDSLTIHGFYKKQVAWLWAHAIDYSEFAIHSYDSLYGHYPYKNFSTTHAGDGGMEYPQLIMITGYRGESSLAGVIAHEIAHQWFYGMLGSNETREAFMDEGFTSFATTQSMQRLWGRYQIPPGTERSWLDWFTPGFDNKSDNYRGYQSLAKVGYEEPLVIPHDWFREDINAGQVYSKTEAILYMLQYTLGDSVFDRGMKNYFDQWHFKHPHLTDFQKVMERTSGTDLDWFFDEWFRTTRTANYAACGVSSDETSGGYETKLHLKNEGLAVMPVDVLLHYTDGTSQDATIPLAVNQGNDYHKPDANRLFFPSWDWVAPSYHKTLLTPKKVSWFEIDTSWRLQDLDWMNNYSGFLHTTGYWALWKQYFANPPLDGYYSVLRPIVWYDQNNKLSLGIGSHYGANFHGSGDFKLFYKFDPPTLPGEKAEWFDHIDGQLRGQHPLYFLDRLTGLSYLIHHIDGISTTNFTLSHTIRPTYLTLGAEHIVSAFFQSFDRDNEYFPVYHPEWSSTKMRTVGVKYNFRSAESTTSAELKMESSVWNADEHFSQWSGKVQTNIDLGSEFGLLLRGVAGVSYGNVPAEYAWHLGRSTTADEQTNEFWRAISDIAYKHPLDAVDLAKQKDLFVLGGTGMRGYPLEDALMNGGSQMLGANMEIGIPNPLASLGSFAQSFSFIAFADAGFLSTSPDLRWNEISNTLREDAGISVKVNVLSWLPSQLQGVANEYATIPTIGVNFPLFVSHPGDDAKALAFRWNVNLGTTF